MTANDSQDLTPEQKAHYGPIVCAHSTKTQPVYCRLLDTQGTYIRYKSSGKLFNIRRFAAKTKVLLALVCDLLYADDCGQPNRLSEACREFGITISLDKTVVMFQPAPGTVYV